MVAIAIQVDSLGDSGCKAQFWGLSACMMVCLSVCLLETTK